MAYEKDARTPEKLYLLFFLPPQSLPFLLRYEVTSILLTCNIRAKNLILAKLFLFLNNFNSLPSFHNNFTDVKTGINYLLTVRNVDRNCQIL